MIGRLPTAPKILLNFEFPKLAMCIVNKRNAQLAASPYARGHDRAYQSYIFAFFTALRAVLSLQASRPGLGTSLALAVKTHRQHVYDSTSCILYIFGRKTHGIGSALIWKQV